MLDNRRRGGRRRSLRAAHLRGLAEAVPVRRGRGILSPGAGVPRAPDREAPRGVPVELPPARQRRARRTAPAALRGRTQVGVPRRPARRRDARRGSARLRAIQAPRGDRAAPRSAGPHAAGCLRAGRHAGVRRRRGELPRRRGDGVPAVRAERSGPDAFETCRVCAAVDEASSDEASSDEASSDEASSDERAGSPSGSEARVTNEHEHEHERSSSPLASPLRNACGPMKPRRRPMSDRGATSSATRARFAKKTSSRRRF